MRDQELKEFYQKRSHDFNVQLAALNKEINLVSTARIIVAIGFLLCFYFALKNYDLFLGLVPILVVFILLVRKHTNLFDARQRLENLITIQTNELSALDNDISCFDDGSEFIEAHHPYAYDLDIFGEGSLFQFLNRSTTHSGKKLLASRMASPLPSESSIYEHHQAVDELRKRIELVHEVQASGLQVKELPSDRRELLDWIKIPSFIYGKPLLRILLTALPILTMASLVVTFFIDGMGAFLWAGVTAQLAICGIYFKRITVFHEFVSRKKTILEKYARLLMLIRKETFTTSLMKQVHQNFHDADEEMKAVADLVGTLNARGSMMVLIANGLLMFDLQCVFRLERWKEKNATRLPQWLATIDEVEVLCSLATLGFNHSSFVFPQVSNEMNLRADALGHPLIDKNERVVNDIYLDKGQSILIITGANMAGKSTFLRTLGVNVVLALMGAPVCATQFECPLIDMRSGMRTADSLKDHQSYFYAELNRLKSIVDELKTGRPLLILLDEILKGTNSNDKQAGSIALVKQLAQHNALVLIATHDLALGDLEGEYPEKIRNYCFEPTIKADQLSFDYKLKRGLAHTMNATFLMKKMGIIPKA